MLIDLENIYLCGVNNNDEQFVGVPLFIVICLKISIFVVSTTTQPDTANSMDWLWFAWKYLSLWYQQQHQLVRTMVTAVVICLKISTFVVSTTTRWLPPPLMPRCDLLENIYLCGSNNNTSYTDLNQLDVVICLKISIFVVATTTYYHNQSPSDRCDLLENIYLCGSNNNLQY